MLIVTAHTLPGTDVPGRGSIALEVGSGQDTFDATIWVVGDAEGGLDAEVAVSDERLRITARGVTLGDWTADEFDLVGRGPRYELYVEGEHLVIDLTGSEPMVLTNRGRHARPA